jgi:hypothetical protein
VEENIVFGKILFLQAASDNFLKRYRIENDSEGIHRIPEFKIIEFFSDIFCKTRTQRHYSGMVIYWKITFGNRYLGSELHDKFAFYKLTDF